MIYSRSYSGWRILYLPVDYSIAFAVANGCYLTALPPVTREMLEFFIIIIGLAFVVYFTFVLIKSLRKRDGRTKPKVWQWVQELVDDDAKV